MEFVDRYTDDLRWDVDQQISRTEILKGIANRFLYSGAYKAFYLFLAVLSFVCLLLNLMQPCPSRALVIMELIINVALVFEVSMRILVQGRMYFRFTANLIDAGLVLFCVLTVILLQRDCSPGAELEEMLDTFLLVLRNSLQFGRLYVMMRKNQLNLETRRNFLLIDEDASVRDFEDMEAGMR